MIVDTPAPAPSEGAAIAALAGELKLLSPDATCVTVAATLGAQTARRMLASLSPARPTAIALTHVDETDQLGVALELSCRSGLPVAYLHEGVDLLNSLSAPDPTLLARRLLR